MRLEVKSPLYLGDTLVMSEVYFVWIAQLFA